VNRARATSNRIGLVRKNIFWKTDFSVVFVVSFPENTISVFVLGVALADVIQCVQNYSGVCYVLQLFLSVQLRRLILNFSTPSWPN